MSYIETIKKLKSTFENDITVNTVVTGDTSQVDDLTKNIYPLVHIIAIDSPFISGNTAVTRYNFEITVVDIRDLNNEDVNDKFWHNDNFHDNLHHTRTILKRAENKLRIDHDVSLVSSGSAVPLIFGLQNLLDGWQQTWTIDTDDTLVSICTIMELLSYTPSREADPYVLTQFDFTFNVDLTLATGEIHVYDSMGNLQSSFNQDLMTVTGKVLSVDVSAFNPFNPIPVGSYYVLIDSGLVTYKNQGNKIYSDPTEITLLIEA